MKYLFSAILCMFIGTTFAQNNDKTIYLDSLSQPTFQGKHTSYRIVKNYFTDSKIYRFQEYYNSGKIKTTGTSVSKDFINAVGQFVNYYESGGKKSSVSYKDNRESGPYTEWYENGNLKLEGEYIPDEKREPSVLEYINYWDANNIQKITDGNGELEIDTDKEKASGKIKDRYKDGLWTGSDKKYNFTYTEHYENKKLLRGKSVDSNNAEYEYTIAEIRPEPRSGGIDDFFKYLQRNFRMPDVPTKGGRIFLTFVIDTDGKVVDVKLLRGVGQPFDQEAIRAISAYTNWKPGIIRGIPVKVNYSIPISIHEQH